MNTVHRPPRFSARYATGHVVIGWASAWVSDGEKLLPYQRVKGQANGR